MLGYGVSGEADKEIKTFFIQKEIDKQKKKKKKY